MTDNRHFPELDRMKSLVDRWEKDNDRRDIFLQCYSMMTSNMMSALGAENFHDANWVSELLRHFADFYFDSLESFDDPDAQASAVWQYAHSVAVDGDAMSVQNLLLGVNAHINYDLVLAVADLLDPEWSFLDEARLQSRYEDYCMVNDIIGETIDSVQDQVLESHDPLLDIIDKLLGPVDELLIRHLIVEWRGDVWNNAIRMLDLDSPQEREMLRRQIERASIQRANLIMHGPQIGF